MKKKPTNFDHKSEVIQLPSGHWVLMRTRPSFEDGIAFASPDLVKPDAREIDVMLGQIIILIQDWSFDADISMETLVDVPDMLDFQTLIETFTDSVLPFLDKLQALRDSVKPSTSPS